MRIVLNNSADRSKAAAAKANISCVKSISGAGRKGQSHIKDITNMTGIEKNLKLKLNLLYTSF